MKTFAEVCKEHGLTISAAAKRFGIPYRTVQDWNAGRRMPPDYVIGTMEEILNYERKEN